MIALVPVRDGVLPAGAPDAIAEAGGRVVIAGSGTADAAVDGLASQVYLAELGPVEISRWTSALAPVIAELPDSDIVVLPHAPDGRDLAPRLAAALERPLLAGATEVGTHRVRVARRGGLELHELRPTGPFVATLQPGTRGGLTLDTPPEVHRLDVDPTGLSFRGGSGQTGETGEGGMHDAHVVEVLPPDVMTMDLTEASRIVGGGAGLDSGDRFAQLDRFAVAIGGVMGATRVITDRSWVHHDRQIGTTGVVIDPELYLSFGVSGAVQHTSGLGHPDHIISVNTDPHCPMMSMSDLAIVADANETLDELLRLLDAIDTAQAAS
ncbi:MAG TPA: mycofactocin-associated electron transfer flavoprotein alpha subunit [Ilumatobacteraceae bacterium]|jgi:electron transfer flavoprotein alpha subunit|nr:mycofactocin-associated electron transfer flavoprotein alpha subunit [Ilumatobacteraceae bacterium]